MNYPIQNMLSELLQGDNLLFPDDDDEVCYLASVHNAVYFAVSVLEKQLRLVEFYI